MSNVRLAANHLTLRIGERTLVRDLSVNFEAGQNWAILGANGSGKSTLLNVLAGLRTSVSGSVRLDGERIEDIAPRERARRIGVLFQETPGGLDSRVLETALTGRHPFLGRWQQEQTEDIALAHAALAVTGLDTLVQRLVSTLSGGERRRLDLATLLTQDAPVCLLDEPVNHLDPHFQIELLRSIAARTQRPGHINLIVLHDVNLALRFCSHGLLLLPDGETRHGPLETLIDATALQAMYGCAMRELRADGARVFVPA